MNENDESAVNNFVDAWRVWLGDSQTLKVQACSAEMAGRGVYKGYKISLSQPGLLGQMTVWADVLQRALESALMGADIGARSVFIVPLHPQAFTRRGPVKDSGWTRQKEIVVPEDAMRSLGGLDDAKRQAFFEAFDNKLEEEMGLLSLIRRTNSAGKERGG